MQHPTTPGGENEAVFTSFLFLGPALARRLFQNETWPFCLGLVPPSSVASPLIPLKVPCVTPALG